MDKGLLIVLVGPTGVGKTELSLRLAEHYHCPIVNADSRQIYKEIPIGTAAPSAEEQQRVKHYFVACKTLSENYNAGEYERDAMQVLQQLYANRTQSVFAILSGGSMMYIDAVCKGLDDIPQIGEDIRNAVRHEYETKGLAWLQQEVERLDPEYWQQVDKLNPQRLMHCVEICRATAKPYSSFRKGQTGTLERPWQIVKIGLQRRREDLYRRINLRVDEMMAQGLEEEARRVYPFRTCNALNTVGYKEMFSYMDGSLTKEEAVDLIRQHSRNYAKRQLTWFRRDTQIHWLDANNDYEQQIHWMDTLLATDFQ